MKTALKYIHNKIGSDRDGKNIGTNIVWLVIDSLLRLLGGVTVGIWMARYLGPDEFGVLSLVIAMTALLMPFWRLGLLGIVPRELILRPDQRYQIMGTTFGLHCVGSCLLITASIFLISIFRPDSQNSLLITIFVACSFIPKSMETIDLWFRSQVLSKYTVISQNCGFFIAMSLRVVFILSGLSVVWFGATVFVEALVAALFLLFFYKLNNQNIRQWNFQFGEAKHLISDSWPLMLAATMNVVFTHIDKVMIGGMIGNHAVGQYEAAVKISSMFYFIPMAVINSFFPSLIQLYKSDEKLFRKRLRAVTSWLAAIAYIVTVPLYFLSDSIILTLFGEQYAPAGSVLSILALSNIFLFIGLSRSPYIIAKNIPKYQFICNLAGGLLNIVLNLFLIKEYQVIGAAYASLISYAVVYFAINLFFKPLRPLLVLQLKSVFLLDLFVVIRKLLISRKQFVK